MVTSTFAHPYAVQVLSLWLSFLPVAGIVTLMAGALALGDRGVRPKSLLRVCVRGDK